MKIKEKSPGSGLNDRGGGVVVALAHVNVLALAHNVKCRCWKLVS
jgi:hypothetical protein